MMCSVILHDGSKKELSIADLLRLQTCDSLSMFGASIKECEDLQTLGKRLKERSERYKLWSENLSNASDMLIKEGLSRKRTKLINELAEVTDISKDELFRIIGK